MKYAELAAFFERLEATSGRLDMTRILVEMLERVPKTQMTATIRLLQGAVAPDWEGLEVGLAEKQILKALAIASGASAKSADAVEQLTTLYKEKGDLGLAAEAVLGAAGGRKQASLFGAESLTVPAVFATLQAIAHTGGTGSQDAKQRLLAKLLLDASPLEARYITRTVSGRLRLGVADMTFMDALASWHLGRGVRSVQEQEDAERAEQASVRARLERAYDLRSDMAVVAAALAEGGMEAVDALGIEPGVPVRPMAAERLKTLPEILEKMEGRVAMEYKYDGLRIQAHVPRSGPVRLFSRRLEEMTAQFPDVAENLRTHFKGGACIVEGEAVALDEAGRLRPFQEISRRRGRKNDLDRAVAEVPVTLFLFDCLAIGGKSVMQDSQEDRRARLAKMVPEDGPVRMSTLAEATTVEAMEAFFDQAVADGAEGIMCKDPRAPYKAGARGFAWIKFKTDYTEALVDTMDLACIGAFFGRGRRAGWYGALLMAAHDPETGVWQSVCKLGTGFDDATLMGLKDRFAPYVSEAVPKQVESGLVPDVWFEPALVMEVQAAELTLSPTHRAGWGAVKEGAGFAARFPRFTGRWRDDKKPEQATTVAELLGMHRMKGQAKT
ncbi:MAG TPA: ATP-dependent DNA ligase [Candidatus Thermoplasmatota archaeon]|nr:ATP-dependent DNA ligase [Candidatus Thermoplasmatota archaeon]